MLTGGAGEVLACALLAVVIVTATTRPRLLPEPVAAVAAAALLLLTGVLSVTQARAAASRLLPVLGFLAAILVLGYLCERAGLFAAAGARLARAAGPGPEPDTGTAPARPPARPVRLLAGVYLLASVTTAVLSLDTTVVLLTPVVYRSARQLRVPPRPHVYACAHLANSASLLLPVSNLTNLLAFAVSGLTLSGFCTLMAGPWAAAIAVEYIVFRRFFAADLARQPEPPADLARQPEPPADLARRAGLGAESAGPGPVPFAGPADRPGPVPVPAAGPDRVPVPWFALVTVAGTLAGLIGASAAGLNPAWAALAGACVLGGRELLRRQARAAGLIRAASLPFLLFVLGLGLVVQAVTARGLGYAVGRLVPGGSSWLALLAIAALAAVLANVVNNLPAVLIMVSVLTAGGAHPAPGPLLAMLIGVNIGPNLSYPGSLANLLWRRLLAGLGYRTRAGDFTRLGLLTTPAALVLASTALWAGLHA